jgi:5-methylcytosine-specific restriction endonuclease McrA
MTGRHDRTERRNYRKGLDLVCRRCGFAPEHPCQVDVHHADGNHHNHDPGNLVPLCANCHRLQTLLDQAPVGSPPT